MKKMIAKDVRDFLSQTLADKHEWVEEMFGQFTNEFFNEVDDRVPDCNPYADMVIPVGNTKQLFLVKIKEIKKQPSGNWE